jgi:hypothetical protein
VLTASDPAEKTKKLSAELANGRLAMMAIIGMFFQDNRYHTVCFHGVGQNFPLNVSALKDSNATWPWIY